jgi:hypothetical protein
MMPVDFASRKNQVVLFLTSTAVKRITLLSLETQAVSIELKLVVALLQKDLRPPDSDHAKLLKTNVKTSLSIKDVGAWWDQMQYV